MKNFKTLLFTLCIIIFTNNLVMCENISEKIKNLEQQLPQVKVSENILYVRPDLQIFLPNGALDLKFKESYKRTLLSFAAKYDFLDNFMGFDLDTGYDLTAILYGINLYDKVDFSEFFSKQETVHRVQNICPYINFPLNKFSNLKFSLGFERNLTTAVDTLVKLDQGSNVLGQVNFINNTISKTNDIPKGHEISFQIRKSFKDIGSDYDYANTELKLTQFFIPFSNQNIEYKLQIGYPLYANKKPLSETYFLGGHELLRGYDFKEFSVDSFLYNQLSYNIPIAKTSQIKFLNISFSILTWKVFLELAKIGDKDIFTENNNFKYCFGSGIYYSFVILKILPLTINLTLSQALETRPTKFYFTISTTYYTWKNE